MVGRGERLRENEADPSDRPQVPREDERLLEPTGIAQLVPDKVVLPPAREDGPEREGNESNPDLARCIQVPRRGRVLLLTLLPSRATQNHELV